ncbi:hypothetical protein L3049_19055 [Labilibaculum sp. DW002]|uniref:Transglutaminase-like domain-containing protein n=1 Tax=Paralabilibaculum antarcticum TaxID=2912572 RepID=A0ABT5VXG6_9BACT|nr:transglutaminase domain-containing protein [Labilibaculum sp. DW002]MDE5420095.1 hypothetical protein [Labilibaculum sp. DW002]
MGQHTIENFDPDSFKSNSYRFNIPDSLTTNTKNIANYISANLRSESNKVKAAYSWITRNISYDVESMYKFNIERNSEVTLKNRKGTCQNYTILFNEIVNKIGIESYIVVGYTKEKGVISRSPHAWCVAKIDFRWFVFDPTWGAGELRKRSFKKKMTYDYFQMRAENAIKTHMPFDPIWQLLNYPVSNIEFEKGKTIGKNRDVYFNYRDSIKKYSSQYDLARIICIKGRIDKGGINNYLSYVYSLELEKAIESCYKRDVTMKYNLALKAYKEGIFSLNRFIDFRNDLFKPDKGDEYLIEMMDDIFSSFDTAKRHLDKIRTPNKITKQKMDQLYSALKADMQNVNAQKKFLDKILSTSKNYRKSLFYDKM